MRKDLAKEILKVERVKTAIDAWYEERKGKVPKNPPNLRRYKLHPVWDKYSLFLFLYHQGVRIGEALMLEWEDLMLDADPPQAQVVQLKKRGGKKKGDRAERKKDLPKRIIPLHREVVKVFREGMREGFANGFVWVKSARAYQKWFRENWDIHPHLLRHACAVRMLKKTGGNLEVVRRILGHADYKVLRTYLDLSLTDLWEVLNR